MGRFGRCWPSLAAVLMLALGAPARLGFGQTVCDDRPFVQAHEAHARIAALLLGRRFAELEQQLSTHHGAYEAGRAAELDIELEFQAFDALGAEFTTLLQEWTQMYPGSYAARLAIGRHSWPRDDAAGDFGSTNGAPVAAPTEPPEADSNVGARTLAGRHCHAAGFLARRPTLARACSIRAKAFGRSRAELDRLYQDSLKAEPDSAVLRAAYAWALHPRRAGSIEELERLAATHANGSDPPARFTMFAINQLLADAYQAKHPEQAIKHWQRAGASCAAVAPHRRLTEHFLLHGDWAQASSSADAILKLDAHEPFGLRAKGVVAKQRGDLTTAAALFQQAAQRGDSVAQRIYGELLRAGAGVARNDEEAQHWMRAAAKQSGAPLPAGDSARGWLAGDTRLLGILIGAGLALAIGITVLVIYLHVRDPGPPVPGLNKLPKPPARE